MKRLGYFIILFLSVVLASAQPSMAQNKDLLRIGIVAPEEGSLALLSTQIKAGFLIHEQQFVGANARYETLEETEVCETGAGEDTAYALLEAQVDLVVGFLCVESLISALPILKQNNIPVININVRGDIVRDEAARIGWPLFSLAPRASDQAEYAAQYILQNWGDKAVALIEDGTIHNREMIDAIRLKLDERGFQPVVLDNYRPGQDKQFGLVRRLAKSNITHIFAGGTRTDTAIIARDAAAINVQFQLAGGDALRAADELVPLPNGVIAILADIGLKGDQGPEVRTVFDQAGIFPDKFPVLAYAVAEIAADLATADNAAVGTVTDRLLSQKFDTVIGPVSFNIYGERQENIFTAMIWQDGRFIKDVKTQ